MKFLFDFFPVILFFVMYKVYGIYAATATAIAASLVQNAFYYARHKRLEKMHVITLVLIIVLGGATLLLKDKTFIMWKPTAVYWAFALVFLGSQFIGDKPLVQRMMGHAIEVPARIWRNANLAMATFSILLGIANLYVADFYFKAEARLSAAANKPVEVEECTTQFQGQLQQLCEQALAMENIWVNFKLFGMLGLSVLFMLGLGVYLALHAKEPLTAKVETGQNHES